jgi:oligopeptide/dipeptide ABC transporter ATP-binding protein
VAELLRLVGLAPEHANRHPHEFSGGQRQRIGIARALALEPSFIVCDEPVSALDVSIQAQIITLMQELQQRLGLTYLFISHNLGIVRQIADRVAVMYLGHIVEIADADVLFSNPRHPYTKALLSAVPHPDPDRKQERIPLKGDPPSPFNPPSGCRFHTRCPIAEARCSLEEPDLRVREASHATACHFA